jgi:hypothetical protein
MPQYVITAPNGKKYRITGETKEGALSALRKHLGDAQPQQQSAAPVAAQPSAPAPTPEMSWSDWGMDVLKGGATGLVKGATSLAGGIGDAQKMTGDVLGWGAGKLGFSPEVQQAATSVGQKLAFPGMGNLPTSEMLRQPIEAAVGPLPKAKSLTGQIVERVGEFVPAAIGGPGTLGRRAAMATVPAVASELAGRIPGVEGSQYQPYVELAAGLATGLPIAGGGKGDALKAMRGEAMVKSRDAKGNVTERFADTTEALTDMGRRVDDAYGAIDKAGIVFDDNAVKSAAMKIKSALANRGWTKVAGGPEAQLLNRVDDLLKPRKVAAWTTVDKILSEAKKVVRTNKDSTVQGNVSVIIDKLEDLVRSGRFTSRKGVTKDEMNALVSEARDLARRDIVGSQIAEMKGNLPGYLVGDEGAFRNQFGSYFKTGKAKGLSDAEREAFAKVVQREGLLGMAHNSASRIGQIAGGVGGGGVGALAGSVFGPAGTVLGGLAGAFGTSATQAGFRKFMDAITEKAVDDALKTILAGRKAQGQALKEEQIESLRATIRAALTSEAATRPVREDWFVQDANGRTYSPTGSGPAVPR